MLVFVNFRIYLPKKTIGHLFVEYGIIDVLWNIIYDAAHDLVGND